MSFVGYWIKPDKNTTFSGTVGRHDIFVPNLRLVEGVNTFVLITVRWKLSCNKPWLNFVLPTCGWMLSVPKNTTDLTPFFRVLGCFNYIAQLFLNPGNQTNETITSWHWMRYNQDYRYCTPKLFSNMYQQNLDDNLHVVGQETIVHKVFSTPGTLRMLLRRRAIWNVCKSVWSGSVVV